MIGPEKINFKIGMMGEGDEPKVPEHRAMTQVQAFRRIDKMLLSEEIKNGLKKMISGYPANSLERVMSRIPEMIQKVIKNSEVPIDAPSPSYDESNRVPVVDPRALARPFDDPQGRQPGPNKDQGDRPEVPAPVQDRRRGKR